MDLSKDETNMLKAIAVIFLLILHLFNTKDYMTLFKPIVMIGNIPLVYYISLVGECCVPIFLFCSGYGLTAISKENKLNISSNIKRIFKLMINYWLVLIIFVLVGFLLGNPRYPGSIREFIGNFLLLSKSYNGTWWFLQSYVILVLLSKFIINFVNKSNYIICFLISGIIYFIAFLQGVKNIIPISNESIKFIADIIVNLAICQFSFILGVIFKKVRITNKIEEYFYKLKYKRITLMLMSLLVLLINSIIENWIIGPITAIAIIVIFKISNITGRMKKILLFLSKHTTNIWLAHMFFYMIFFKKIIFAPRYPILILAWLLTICIFTSVIINYIYGKLMSLTRIIVNNSLKAHIYYK